MYQASRDTHILHGQAGEGHRGSAGPDVRLQTIHDLVSSGDYHVPAAAIADRIIERIIVDKQENES